MCEFNSEFDSLSVASSTDNTMLNGSTQDVTCKRSPSREARFAWAEGYATGEPKNRYANNWGYFIWTSLVGTFTASCAVGLELLGVL